MNLTIPQGILLAAVNSGKDIEIAMGTTRVKAGDTVFLFVLPGQIAKAEALFAGA